MSPGEFERGQLVQAAQWLCHKVLSDEEHKAEAQEFARHLGNVTGLHKEFYDMDPVHIYSIAQVVHFAATGNTLAKL